MNLYITVYYSNIEPPTVTTFPGYKGHTPRKTASTWATSYLKLLNLPYLFYLQCEFVFGGEQGEKFTIIVN